MKLGGATPSKILKRLTYYENKILKLSKKEPQISRIKHIKS
ncbi:hypothetical protein FEDK69T_01730 [Flavobacterium enshiense DK69]|nr:hypothetical protein FEDK69T_01730 [Flavobacterium enshiense DK69]